MPPAPWRQVAARHGAHVFSGMFSGLQSDASGQQHEHRQQKGTWLRESGRSKRGGRGSRAGNNSASRERSASRSQPASQGSQAPGHYLLLRKPLYSLKYDSVPLRMRSSCAAWFGLTSSMPWMGVKAREEDRPLVAPLLP